MPSTRKTAEAVLWVLFSTALFTIVFAAAKFADGIIGTFQILVLRYIGAFATASCLAARSAAFGQCNSKVAFWHFMRAVFGCSAAAAITWASAHMPLADASAIGILYGIVTVLFGIVFLKERVGVRHWLAVLISLAGATLIMFAQGAFQSSLSALPALIAVLSAILMSAEGVLIRILSQTESALTMMLYVSGFGILLMGAPAVLEWKNVNGLIVLGCLGLGPVSVVAQYCTIRGYRIAPLSVVGPVDYSWLIFALVLGMVAFDEYPTCQILAGGALIIVGGGLLTGVHTERPMSSRKRRASRIL